MATFPELVPNQIGFDMGQSNISEVETFAGPIRFRHSQRISGHALQLTYQGLSLADIQKIRNHYTDSGGTHFYFDLPVTVWGGISLVASNSVYRYTAPPQEEHTGLHYNVTVSLRIVDGVLLLYILNGNTATQPAVSAFTSFALTGNQPFILNGNAADLTSAAITNIFNGGGASL